MYTMRKYHLLFILVFLFIGCNEEPENSYVLKVTVSPDDAGQVDPSEGEFSPGEVVELTRGRLQKDIMSSRNGVGNGVELKIHFP